MEGGFVTTAELVCGRGKPVPPRQCWRTVVGTMGRFLARGSNDEVLALATELATNGERVLLFGLLGG